jgi:hypothetical protein
MQFEEPKYGEANKQDCKEKVKAKEGVLLCIEETI